AIKAPPGFRFIAADFSGIESRVLSWLAGEQWKVDQWAKFDRTGDPKDEPYYILGKKFGFDDDKARKPGKGCELAFGYGGRENSYRNFCGYEASSEEVERLNAAYCEAHPATVKFWYALEKAAIKAAANPGTVQGVNQHIQFCCRDGKCLRMKLP